ncbi:hypothetical protein ACWGQQ_37365 [Bradyrhizobium sp. Lot33]
MLAFFGSRPRQINEIAQSINQFVRASYRMQHNKFGPSLDMPAFQEGVTRLDHQPGTLERLKVGT